MNPLVSIVIANYNYGRFLEEAIRSVVTQDGFDECELIVVDGGSTDNSVEVIKKHEDKIAWWVSEKDKGQSDAFIKGFAKARGRFLTWLNADDFLVPGCLARALRQIERHSDWEWLSGETVYVDAEGKVVTTGIRMLNLLGQFLHVPAWARITAPSTFFTKDLYERSGGMDLDLHYVMDTDLWMRFALMGARLHYLYEYVWVFRLHEQSKTSASVISGARSQRFLEERARIRCRRGIARFSNFAVYFGKRICCLLSLGYVQRWAFLLKNRNRLISDVKW